MTTTISQRHSAPLRAAANPAADPSMAPRALFSGSHGRVLVVGESRLAGVPFRDRSDGSPSCRVARAVVDALTVLASAGTGPNGGPHAAEALMALLERHNEIHRPPADHVRFSSTRSADWRRPGTTFIPSSSTAT